MIGERSREIGLFVKVLGVQANGKDQLEREKFMMQKRKRTFRRKVSEELRGVIGYQWRPGS